MGAFELNSSTHRGDTRSDARAEIHNAESFEGRRPRPECIIALKVYDDCRLEECLDNLGPAHAVANDGCGCSNELFKVPDNAEDVVVDAVKVKEIEIVRKQPSKFKANGYWDLRLRFAFEYRLTFFDRDNDLIGTRLACSTYTKSLTLFGAVGSDLAISTDMLRTDCGSTINSDPFVLAEAKAIALSAELACVRPEPHCGRPEPVCRPEPACGRPEPPFIRPEPYCDRPDEYRHPVRPDGQRGVFVTIGLYSIIKLFRIVSLSVESRGFCELPGRCECEDLDPINPCKFFETLAFPRDIFAPPIISEC